MEKNQFIAQDANEMHLCGQQIAHHIISPSVIYLNGDLGAGKTTLVQGILQFFDYKEVVSSPSYNLIHQYPTKHFDIAHLDLYRLDNPEEITMLGLADLLSSKSILFVEWPEKGEGYLPQADMIIDITYQSMLNIGRVIELKFLH